MPRLVRIIILSMVHCKRVNIFINSGLRYFVTGTDADNISILEVGLGTGLNFLLSAEYCTAKQIKLNYTGIEAYPLTEEMIAQTSYEEYISAPIWNCFLKVYPTSILAQVQLNPYVELYTAHTQLTSFQSNEQFDVIYFDAFASLHQPEMWSEEAIRHTVQFLKPGGVFVTYAITGNLKRMLKALGLKVEKAPGAPGKREMLRATLPLLQTTLM
jgi:tRNA U34 5-methylaminomethyl-2-thiouridine-forming methyltransferase MnmC